MCLKCGTLIIFKFMEPLREDDELKELEQEEVKQAALPPIFSTMAPNYAINEEPPLPLDLAYNGEILVHLYQDLEGVLQIPSKEQVVLKDELLIVAFQYKIFALQNLMKLPGFHKETDGFANVSSRTYQAVSRLLNRDLEFLYSVQEKWRMEGKWRGPDLNQEMHKEFEEYFARTVQADTLTLEQLFRELFPDMKKSFSQAVELFNEEGAAVQHGYSLGEHLMAIQESIDTLTERNFENGDFVKYFYRLRHLFVASGLADLLDQKFSDCSNSRRFYVLQKIQGFLNNEFGFFEGLWEAYLNGELSQQEIWEQLIQRGMEFYRINDFFDDLTVISGIPAEQLKNFFESGWVQ